MSLFRWFLIPIFLAAQAAASASTLDHQDDEAFVTQVLNNADEQDQRDLLFGFGNSNKDIEKSSKAEGEACNSSDECQGRLECSPMGKVNRCMANSSCLQRELDILGTRFDPVAYKQMLFREAAVTEEDVWTARKENPDNDAFANSAPVQALMNTIHNHRQELGEIAQVIHECGDGMTTVYQPQPEQVQPRSAVGKPGFRESVGDYVGSFFSNAMNRIFDSSDDTNELAAIQGESTPTVSAAPSLSKQPSLEPTVSSAPSVSTAPSMTPSIAPTNDVLSTTYAGLHLEGGFLLDGSYSLYGYGDANRLYGRSCLGFEAGAGAEIGIAVLVSCNRYINDIVGGSLLLDMDLALGAAFGLGAGVFVSGESTLDRPLHYEVTIGAGLGAGLMGFSVCRTLRVQNPNDPTEQQGGSSSSTVLDGAQ